MALYPHFNIPTDAYDVSDLDPTVSRGERVVTVVASSLAVLIVAVVAVLMAMA